MFDVLPHLRPEVGGGDFNVRFVSRVVSSKDAVVGFTHGLLSVSCGKIQCCPWIVEIAQSNPDELVLVLK